MSGENNSYKHKYLKYKKKYIILKNQIGAVNLDGTKYRFLGRHGHFECIRDIVTQYLDNTPQYNDIRSEFFPLIKENCEKACWMEFIRAASFSQYLTSSNTDIFYLFPFATSNMDEYFSSKQNYIRPNNNIIGYAFKNKFFNISFTDIIMFDYDEKDFSERDFGKKPDRGIILQYLINKLQRVVNGFKSRYNIDINFLFVLTDRGFHFFLLNKTGSYRNLFIIELMIAICNDNWYNAFVYSNGWAVRLNKKTDKPDDFIAELSFAPQFKDFLERCASVEPNTIPNQDEHIRKSHDPNDKTYGNFTFKSSVFTDAGSHSIHKPKDITLYYPLNKDDPSLFIIKPTVPYRGTPNDEVSVKFNELVISNIDQTDYVFNKICYHYCLIQYFRDFEPSMIKKLECCIGDRILKRHVESDFLTNLRADLDIISSHFNIPNIITNNPNIPNFRPHFSNPDYDFHGVIPTIKEYANIKFTC